MKKFITYVRQKPEIEEVAKLEEVREQQSLTRKKFEEIIRKRNEKFRFTNNWFNPNIPRWEKTFYHLKDKKINVLEIGVFEGRSTTWILEELAGHHESKLVAIDNFGKFGEIIITKKFFMRTLKGLEKKIR